MIGIIFILAGNLTAVVVKALSTDTFTITTPLRSWYYVGIGISYTGASLVCITLIAGALLEEKFNPYVRLGMLIAAGWILAYVTLIRIF